MNRIEEYILMYQDDEVLSFRVSFGERNRVQVLEKLEHFEKAPFGMKEETKQEELDRILYKFFNGRTLACTRWDYEDIIKNTGCHDDFELSFKGHGLSLSNHYWYKKPGEKLKYKDINFFTNKWDDSFARAVLSGNYEALKGVDLNVPDIVTCGKAIKGWLCEDKPRLYKLGILKDHNQECLSEVLTSKLAQRLLKEDEVLDYELTEIYGKYASVSEAMIKEDEEFVTFSDIFPEEIQKLYHCRRRDKDSEKKFLQSVKEIPIPGLPTYFVKLFCLTSLCCLSDLHLDNIAAIRNTKTGKMRTAPFFDLAGGFGSSVRGKELLLTLNQAVLFLICFGFGSFDPEWDYSWYKKERLIGFEQEIQEILSKSDYYSETLIENIITIYQQQKSALDQTSNISLTRE